MDKIQEIGKRLDKIRIDYKEYQTIKKWNTDKDNHGMYDRFVDNRNFFPLNNFVLDVAIHKHGRLVLLVELDNHDPCNAVITGENMSNGELWTISYRREIGKGWHFDGTIPEPPQGINSQDAVTMIHVILVSVFMYICLKARDRITRVSPETTRKERENYEYKERELYLLNDIVKYVSIHPNKSSIKYRCECWGVRGHIRHYKNGKVVFIEPYKKGKKRDVLEPKSKTYLLKRGDDK